MSERGVRDAFDALTRWTPTPEQETARLRLARERVRVFAGEERRLLERAVSARDDATARWLELWADTAWRNAHAVHSEHHPDPYRPETDT